MCTGCISWVQTPSVNLGISHTPHQSKFQRLCMYADPLFNFYHFVFSILYRFLSRINYTFSLNVVLTIFSRYEDAFNKFVDEINALAAYQWWEGSIYSILCILSYPMAWSWQQWRRRMKLQKIREFVRSEYDHSCLRSCRSRALYEGLKACIYYFLLYVQLFSNISIS